MDEDKKLTPDPSKVDPAKVDDGGKKQDDKGGDTPKTYTEDELQAERDRIAAKVRSEEKLRADKAQAKAVAEAKVEAERLAKLSEDERVQEQRKRDTEEIEKTKADLSIRENKLTVRSKIMELTEGKATDEEITSIANLVTTIDGEDSVKRATDFITVTKNMAARMVKDQLAGKTLKDPEVTKKDIATSAKSYF